MANGALWHPDEDKYLLDHPGLAPAELADALREQGRTPQSCQKRRERLSQLEAVKILSADTDRVRVQVPKSEKPNWDRPINLSGPSCLVMGDLHMDFHDEAFISRCIELALDWGVRHVAIGGDILDVEAFSKFGPDPENILEAELDSAETFLDNVASAFDEVKISLGNHEARLLGKALNRQVKTARFKRMITNAENVEISSYEWMTMDSPEGPWAIIHPKNSSVIPGRVPAEIARNRFSDHHVIGFHGHLWGLTKSTDGKRWVWDVGMCAAPLKMAYAIKSVSTRPVMVQGAGIIYEGRPHPILPNSDFTALRRMYGRAA